MYCLINYLFKFFLVILLVNWFFCIFGWLSISFIISISVADPDSFHLVSRIRIRFMKKIRVAKNQPKSWKISTKKSTKIRRISWFFSSKILNLCLTDINIYPMKKKGIFSILEGRIRSRIRMYYFIKRIRGSGSISKSNGSGSV